MKFLTLSLLIIAANLFAQEPDWSRFYQLPVNYRGNFSDVFRTADRGFAFAGWCDTVGPARRSGYWLVKTDSEGFIEINNFYQPPSWRDVECWSIVQCDDGGYLLGGAAPNDTTASPKINILRTDPDGNEVWWLSRPFNSECYAVIELKSGEYIACGRKNSSEAFAMKFDDDANIVWEKRYPQNIAARFNTVREVEGGYLFGGEESSGGIHAKLVKTDGDGEVIWANSYDFPQIYALISCREGGFAATGGYSQPDVEGGTARLLRVDNGGNQIWCHGYEAFSYAYGVAELPDGFVIVGTHTGARITRTDQEGDSLWTYVFHGRERAASNLFSVISDQTGAIYAAGGGSRNGTRGGVLIKFTPERLAPMIVEKHPATDELSVLQNDSIFFSIRAIDHQNDSLSYLWLANNQDYFPDNTDSFAACITFPNLGIDTLQCIVWDEQGSDTATWLVTVNDLYISAFTPDTLNLTLRRGASVDFSLDTVRYVGEQEPEYLWTKTNMNNGRIDGFGDASEATIDFPYSGAFAVEGRAFRGESSDSVLWNVEVKGVVWAFAPEVLTFDVEPDSVVHFEVVPSEPENESLSIQWLVDGEVAAEDTVALEWAFGIAGGEADSCPPYQVQCVVADSVEADTVTWDVTVRDLAVPHDGSTADPPRSAGILSVSPNPFNSMLTIMFSLTPGFGEAGLRIYDLSGRLVVDLTTGRNAYPPGEHKVVWDAGDQPAGVYLVRLENGAEISTQKVVLIR